MRSAIFGAVLAVVVIVATVTFGSSLGTLLSQPRLYGWNWNYMLLSGFSGDEDLPAGQTASLLAHDHEVVAASGVYFASIEIEGQNIGVMATSPKAAVGPPILTGHGLEAANQIVLGAETMAALHAKVGQTLEVRTGGKHAVPLVVAGSATMPSLMGLDMGHGAVIDYELIPGPLRNSQGNAVPGPNAYLIDTRGRPSAAVASLQRIIRTINMTPVNEGSAGGAVSILRPTEIVDSGSIEAIPTILGAGLAGGAVAALSITLIASVQRRRRDLAVLRVLGLSGRQLASNCRLAVKRRHDDRGERGCAARNRRRAPPLGPVCEWHPRRAGPERSCLGDRRDHPRRARVGQHHGHHSRSYRRPHPDCIAALGRVSTAAPGPPVPVLRPPARGRP